jgi:hypothetical protein
MVAGLSRKSRNVSIHHFKPTRPTKEQDLSLPNLDVDIDLLGQRQRGRSTQTFVLRPKNDRMGTSAVTSKPKNIERKSKDRSNRRTTMSNNSEGTTLSSNERVAIHEAERRYILRPQIGYSSNSINVMMTTNNTNTIEDTYYSADEQVVSGILDGITSLCLGPASNPHRYSARNGNSDSQRLTSPPQRRNKKVVYPIASYPARLNCKKLVSERRAVFQQNLFRPVSSDEMSHYQQSAQS